MTKQATSLDLLQKRMETKMRGVSSKRDLMKHFYNFTVDNVLKEYSGNVPPKTGKKQNGGISNLVLSVTAEHKFLKGKIGVEELEFKIEGFSTIQTGDSIRAMIVPYKETDKGYYPRLHRRSREEAYKIEILGKNNEVLRTEKSVDYNDFMTN